MMKKLIFLLAVGITIISTTFSTLVKQPGGSYLNNCKECKVTYDYSEKNYKLSCQCSATLFNSSWYKLHNRVNSLTGFNLVSFFPVSITYQDKDATFSFKDRRLVQDVKEKKSEQTQDNDVIMDNELI